MKYAFALLILLLLKSNPSFGASEACPVPPNDPNAVINFILGDETLQAKPINAIGQTPEGSAIMVQSKTKNFEGIYLGEARIRTASGSEQTVIRLQRVDPKGNAVMRPDGRPDIINLNRENLVSFYAGDDLARFTQQKGQALTQEIKEAESFLTGYDNSYKSLQKEADSMEGFPEFAQTQRQDFALSIEQQVRNGGDGGAYENGTFLLARSDGVTYTPVQIKDWHINRDGRLAGTFIEDGVPKEALGSRIYPAEGSGWVTNSIAPHLRPGAELLHVGPRGVQTRVRLHCATNCVPDSPAMIITLPNGSQQTVPSSDLRLSPRASKTAYEDSARSMREANEILRKQTEERLTALTAQQRAFNGSSMRGLAERQQELDKLWLQAQRGFQELTPTFHGTPVYIDGRFHFAQFTGKKQEVFDQATQRVIRKVEITYRTLGPDGRTTAPVTGWFNLSDLVRSSSR